MIKLGDKTVKRLSFNSVDVKRAYLGDKLIFDSTLIFYTDRDYNKHQQEIYMPGEMIASILRKAKIFVKINDYPEVRAYCNWSGAGEFLKLRFEKRFRKYDWFPGVLEIGAKVVVRFE